MECESTALIMELSRFVLTNNYFEAEGVLYHQQWGLAMGTPMAIAAAVIFMTRLEEPCIFLLTRIILVIPKEASSKLNSSDT